MGAMDLSQQTYPFTDTSTPNDFSKGVNQTFNIQPTASAAGQPQAQPQTQQTAPFKKGGKVKKMSAGGSASSASKRGDGCAQRGKTRGKMV
jgi:hypothetical protein